MILIRENKELGENPVQCNNVHHKSHIHWPGTEPWAQLSKASDQPPELW